MRVALLVFVAGCGHIAVIEPPASMPATTEEACLQREMDCLRQSRSSTETIPLLFPLAVFSSQKPTSEIILRHCKLQGELCRVRGSKLPKSARDLGPKW